MAESPVTITLQIGELDKATSRYPLRLLSAGKKGSKELALEWIAQDQLDRANTKLPFADPVTTFLENEESEDFDTIGEYLYNLLRQGDVKQRWDELQGERVRVELEIIPTDLAAFPWELLSDGLNRLAMDPNMTLTRKFTLAKVKKPANPDSGPLRVLILVGAKDDEKDVLPWSEVRRIEAEIRKLDRQEDDNLLVHRMIDINVVVRPTIEKLQSEYENFKPHIFHFIGHGELIGKRGALVINVLNEATKKFDEIKWRADDIFTKIQSWKWLPQLAFINACRSDSKETPTEEIREQAWSIGDVFRRLGVPAVLSMQADINGERAGVFAGTLYKSLAELKPLDEAVALARTKIMTPGVDARDWAVPVLTLAVAPEEVLHLNPKAPAERLVEIKECAAFKDIDFFSDCAQTRRKLIRGFYPLPPQTADKDLIIVKGKDETGKSWLAKWCMEVCALLNHDIRYVEIGGTESRTWLDVLQQIRDGDDTKQNSQLIYQPLNQTAFHRFNWELEYRFRGEVPPSEFDNSVVPARKVKLADPKANWTPKFEGETFESFQRAIVQAAQINNSLIIVLDHFTKGGGISPQDMTDLFIPNLVVPAAKQKFREQISPTQMRSVKFILVLTEKEFETFKFDELVNSYHLVPVAPFNPDEAKEIILEYMRYFRPESNEEDRKNYVEALGQLFLKAKAEWTPKALVDLVPRKP